MTFGPKFGEHWLLTKPSVNVGSWLFFLFQEVICFFLELIPVFLEVKHLYIPKCFGIHNLIECEQHGSGVKKVD